MDSNRQSGVCKEIEIGDLLKRVGGEEEVNFLKTLRGRNKM